MILGQVRFLRSVGLLALGVLISPDDPCDCAPSMSKVGPTPMNGGSVEGVGSFNLLTATLEYLDESPEKGRCEKDEPDGCEKDDCEWDYKVKFTVQSAAGSNYLWQFRVVGANAEGNPVTLHLSSSTVNGTLEGAVDNRTAEAFCDNADSDTYRVDVSWSQADQQTGQWGPPSEWGAIGKVTFNFFCGPCSVPPEPPLSG